MIFKEDLEKAGVKVNLQILDGALVGNMFGAGNFEAGIRAFGNQPDLELRKAIWQPEPALLLALLNARQRQLGRNHQEHD